MNTDIETYDKRMYLSQLELARYLFKGLDEKTEEIDFTKHFQLVLDCWDMLDDWSFTYRYLSCLVSMCEFQENSIARNELFNILNTISEEWSKGE